MLPGHSRTPFTLSTGFVGGDFTKDSNYDHSLDASAFPNSNSDKLQALTDYFRVAPNSGDHSIDLGAWADALNLTITKQVASGSALPNNPFNFTLEKVITNASGQLELDSSFTPIDFTLEDNASRLFYLLPMGDYRLKETLPPLYQITALTNATAITPLTAGEVQFSIDAKLSNPNIAYGQMQVVIAHELGHLGEVRVNIADGSPKWVNYLRTATISATATNQPLEQVVYSWTPFAPGSCEGGTNLTLSPTSPYAHESELTNLPSSQGKHSLYACAKQVYNPVVATASANFNYDSIPLVCTWQLPPASTSAYAASFTADCSDPGFPTTGSGPCPTLDPGDPNLACPNNYLNVYTCTTEASPGATCSITVSDYAGNLATFTTPSNPFVAHPDPYAHSYTNPNSNPNSNSNPDSNSDSDPHAHSYPNSYSNPDTHCYSYPDAYPHSHTHAHS